MRDSENVPVAHRRDDYRVCAERAERPSLRVRELSADRTPVLVTNVIVDLDDADVTPTVSMASGTLAVGHRTNDLEAFAIPGLQAAGFIDEPVEESAHANVQLAVSGGTFQSYVRFRVHIGKKQARMNLVVIHDEPVGVGTFKVALASSL